MRRFCSVKITPMMRLKFATASPQSALSATKDVLAATEVKSSVKFPLVQKNGTLSTGGDENLTALNMTKVQPFIHSTFIFSWDIERILCFLFSSYSIKSQNQIQEGVYSRINRWYPGCWSLTSSVAWLLAWAQLLACVTPWPPGCTLPAMPPLRLSHYYHICSTHPYLLIFVSHNTTLCSTADSYTIFTTTIFSHLL